MQANVSESVRVGSEENIDTAEAVEITKIVTTDIAEAMEIVVDVGELAEAVVDVAAITTGATFGRYLSLWEWEASRPRGRRA